MKFKITEEELYKLFDGNAVIYWEDIFDKELEGELVENKE